jgi:hypothetical protein
VLAVTADRGLRARLPEGTAVTGPGRLLDVLDRTDGTARTDARGRTAVPDHNDVPDRMADNGPG